MGVVIYTADERPYKEGNYVEMFNEINTSPSVKELTCILHTDKFKEKDALEWRQLISHRLVIVTEKKPKLTEKSEDFVILDPSLDKEEEDYIRATGTSSICLLTKSLSRTRNTHCIALM